MNSQTWTVQLEEDFDTGDLVLPLNSDMLQAVGWKDGDTIEWVNNHDGSWSLVKQSDKKNK